MNDDNARQIRLRGVRVNNLKGVDLDLPLNRLIAFSGVSGSGKSSLAFDTLYAEGQRRYIETFSAYTRQFLAKLEKPDAEKIDGIPPAIAVGQHGTTRSSRSTVGTITEIHEYLGLLFAKAGQVICRVCGRTVHPADAASISNEIEGFPEKTRYMIAFPWDVLPGSDREALASSLREDCFTRVRVDGQVVDITSSEFPMPEGGGQVEVIVDRLVRGTDAVARRFDSIETAFRKGMGRCRIIADDTVLTFYQGWRCSGCGTDAIEPSPRLFSYNSPLGACPTCEGFGSVIDLDLDRIVPDRSKTLRNGAIAAWTTPAYRENLDELIQAAPGLDIPLDVPFKRLKPEQVAILVDGMPEHGFIGIRGFFRRLERKSYKMHVRVFLSRWRGYSTCPSCQGARLRPESLAVKLGGKDIAAVLALSIKDASTYLREIQAGDSSLPLERIVSQVSHRVDFLTRIGLDYLSLDRPARTLSRGEGRRVSLTSALGSGLVNTLYVLDEPSVGLHPVDVGRLISVMTALRDAGNSVVVVEHDASILHSADLLIDIGPGAGELGGRVLYQGPPSKIAGTPQSVTADFLVGKRRISAPRMRRKSTKGTLNLLGAKAHNLKNIDVSFPLGMLCVVSGVSGSGKSTLVEETLYPALRRRLGLEAPVSATHTELTGTSGIDDVVMVDQAPIGRSGRSNPVTYLKAFDEIRKTFAATHEAKLRNYGAGTFSFNVEGGRCNACEGNGFQTVDMQFLPDVLIRCPECLGTRYRPETLEIAYRGRNIAEVLDLTAREAFSFFRHRPKVQARLRPLIDVGLDYLRLGQPASTLSGGEAQRLKLASYLATSPGALTRAASREKTLFILDEPTSGLHPADILRLLDAINSLLDIGHSLIVIEHSPEMMISADWILELGPGAGADGGQLIAQGTPEAVATMDTPTGRVLRELLSPPST